MKNLSLFLAWNYLKGTTKDKSISTMVIICFLGIFIGSFALALVASVMNGFEKVTHEKMQSIHPQIVFHAQGETLNIEKISTVFKNEFPEIEFFSPNTIKQVIAQSDTDEDYTIIILKGIDPHSEHNVCKIEDKIIKSIDNSHNLSTIVKENHVIIGQKLAQNLDVAIGDKINLYFSQNEKIKHKQIKLDQNYVIVGGIFKTGIEEFDNGLIIGDLPFVNTMFKDSGATQIGIKLKPGTNESKTITTLRNRFSMEAHSWQSLYPALVEALQLEKYAMFLILALITLVASMNIISLLFMQITQKRADIAILKAMGMPDKHISKIFLYLGMTISFTGSIIGLGFAYISGWLLEHYAFIKLPDAYYVTHLPVRMEWPIFAIVFIVVMLLSFLSTWIPARKIRGINISQVLRFEG